MKARALLAGLALLFAACGGDEGQPRPPTRDAAEGAGGGLDFERVETVAEGLEVPWGLAFVDADTILVSERPGRVRLIENGELREEPVGEVEVAAAGEGGLLGMALDPDFPEQRFAYAYYTTAEGNRVSRFALDERLRFGEEEVLLDSIPAAVFHDGGQIAFGPDGRLYVATGDATQPETAADPRSPSGKILRLERDGSIPGDNPLGGSPVFSYGHRNPQGLDWDGEGRLYASEHGPTGEFGLCCNDEVNLVEAGRFYGWPFRAGGVDVAGGDPPEEPVEPLATSGDSTWAPAGLAVHEPDEGPTSLLVATLAGQRLLRFPLDQAGTAGEPEVALEGLGRLRAAAFGPDGCLYLTTSNRDGRGEPSDGDDRVARVCPRP